MKNSALYEKVIEMGNVSFVDTSTFTHEQWLALRTTGIGGSDAGAIMGMNKYASPLTVYFQKKGIDGFTGNASTEWGHILEEPIRRKTEEELGVYIERVSGTYRSRKHEFMTANLDGIVNTNGKEIRLGEQTVSGIGGYEIKTSSRGDGFTDDEIPDSYYCQVQHYMSVTGLPWFILTVFFLGSRTGRHYIVPRKDKFIEMLIEKEKDFWVNYVMADRIPEPLGVDSETEYLKNIPLPAEITFADAEMENIVSEEQRIDAEIKRLTEERDRLKNSIICKLAESAGAVANDAGKTVAIAGRFRITYNTQSRNFVDSDALRRNGLLDAYSKKSVFKVLRINEVKK